MFYKKYLLDTHKLCNIVIKRINRNNPYLQYVLIVALPWFLYFN